MGLVLVCVVFFVFELVDFNNFVGENDSEDEKSIYFVGNFFGV